MQLFCLLEKLRFELLLLGGRASQCRRDRGLLRFLNVKRTLPGVEFPLAGGKGLALPPLIGLGSFVRLGLLAISASERRLALFDRPLAVGKLGLENRQFILPLGEPQTRAASLV